MTAAPTILRTKHMLSDYLVQQDKAKFKLNKKSSRPWIINNPTEKNKFKEVIETNLATDFETILSLHNSSSSNFIPKKSSASDQRLQQNLHSKDSPMENNKPCVHQNDISNNNNFNVQTRSSKENVRPYISSYPTSTTKKAFPNQEAPAFVRPKWKSPNSNRKFYKGNMVEENNALGRHHIFGEEDTLEDRERQERFARDLEMEQQEQVNRMFNNTQAASIPPKHPLYCPPPNSAYTTEPPLYIQGPHGMFYVLVPPPPPISPDTSGSVGESSENEGSEDGDSIQDVSEELILDNHVLDWSSGLERQNVEKEHSLEDDEELNNLVLSIIDD